MRDIYSFQPTRTLYRHALMTFDNGLRDQSKTREFPASRLAFPPLFARSVSLIIQGDLKPDDSESQMPAYNSRSFSTPTPSRNGLSVSSYLSTNSNGVANGSRETGVRSTSRLLSALSQEAWDRLSTHMRRISLEQSNVLHESGDDVDYVYFIESGMISVVTDSADGAQVEVGVIGNEGIVGALAALGNQASFHRTIVQIPGKAMKLSASLLREECARNAALRELLHNHFYVQMAQASQSALCNRTHTVEERLSRWLLTVRDRAQSNELDLTHEFIAHMLGARRSGVTVALGILQQSGMVDVSRGHISLVNTERLQSCACDCYATIREQFELLEEKTAA
jgi:CRP-like cAMP-binding protein